VVRAAGSFGHLGLDGLRAFAAAGGRVRVSEDVALSAGARVFPQAGADGVILERSQAQRFLDGISCAVSALPALCFPAGTRVATPKGERAIDRLRVGDLVLAEDPKTGKVEAERVTATIAHPASPLLALDLSDGSSIRVQPNHAFWVDGGPGLRRAGWLQAGQLRPGDRLRTAGGKAVTVVRVRWNVGSAPVYTLTVARDHTFFVGRAQVLVHNADNAECIGTAEPAKAAGGTIVDPRTAREVPANYIDDVSTTSLRNRSLNNGVKLLVKKLGLAPRIGERGSWEFVDAQGRVRVRWDPSNIFPSHWHKFAYTRNGDQFFRLKDNGYVIWDQNSRIVHIPSKY